MLQKPRKKSEEFALSVTSWVGSVQSIVLHTTLFVLSFGAVALGILPFDRMLLVLTTVVSLEAIYLSIFIQMTINITSATIEGVEQDIDEIQEDIGEIQEDVDEIQEDVDELQEDLEELNEDDLAEEKFHAEHERTLSEIHEGLQRLMADVEKLQNEKK
jgi:septal ring factor EnvC (AmiA/AmiB activator)